MNKNEKVLKEFVKYCEKHPEYRFFQAIRNWLGIGFVYVSDELIPDAEDTFFWEEKDH